MFYIVFDENFTQSKYNSLKDSGNRYKQYREKHSSIIN